MLEATKRIVAVKNIETPDERHAFEHASLNVVNLPGVTIARTVYQPGWKWSTDVKPVVGTEACQAAHTGYIISGRLHARMDDGREYDFGPGDAHVVSAGHDAWVEGDEPCVALDLAFTGRALAGHVGRCPCGVEFRVASDDQFGQLVAAIREHARSSHRPAARLGSPWLRTASSPISSHSIQVAGARLSTPGQQVSTSSSPRSRTTRKGAAVHTLPAKVSRRTAVANRRRESAAYGHIRRRFREHAPGLYVPIRRHHRQRRPRASQGNKPGDDHDPRYRRHATSAPPAAVRSGTHGGPLEDHAVHVPADAGAVRRGLLRHLASPPPGFGHFPHPLAVAEHDAAPAVTLIYLPVQGPCR